jgi:hypothetical protein
MTQPNPTLTPEQADAFGRELDGIKERVMADLGQIDADYIRRVIKTQRTLEVSGRALRLDRHLKDSRQHGDRPQHHARPVRLDA